MFNSSDMLIFDIDLILFYLLGYLVCFSCPMVQYIDTTNKAK